MQSVLWTASSAMMLALLLLLALRAFDELLGLRPRRDLTARLAGAGERLSPARWPWPLVFLASLGVLWLGAFWGHVAVTGSPEGFFSHYWSRFTEAGDSPRYLFMAENGYVRTGEYVNNIVFYPLYPLLMRLLGALLGGRTALAGLILSQVCYGFSAVVLRRLAEREHAHAGWVLAAYWLYPFGFFSMGIFTEGLFLLLTVSGLYLLRQRRWLAAGLVGLLCALTRIQGILLLLPGVYCAWRDIRQTRRWNWRYLALAGSLAGFGVYLGINRAVCGSFFAFQYYESIAPWYQSVQWLGDTLAQQFDMALEHTGLANWIYWPQLVLYFAGGALLLAGLCRKLDTAHVLYGVAYLGMCYTSGWLISGGRYMLGCLPLYLCVGRLKSPLSRAAVLAAEALAFFFFNYWYMQAQAIM